MPGRDLREHRRGGLHRSRGKRRPSFIEIVSSCLEWDILLLQKQPRRKLTDAARIISG